MLLWHSQSLSDLSLEPDPQAQPISDVGKELLENIYLKSMNYELLTLFYLLIPSTQHKEVLTDRNCLITE